ncbi:hypothetical protein ACFL1G_08835 [Planctomycetota bacterium]
MDLKGSEKVEWEALRLRRNRLLIYAAEKECDFGGAGLPDKILSPKEAKELTKKLTEEKKQQQSEAKSEVADSAVGEIITCFNCDATIGRLEEPYNFNGHIVCAECYKKLTK